MKKEFSKSWISSKQPRKQRKYRANAPLNIKRRFLSVHLSKELIKKHKKRNMLIRKGDKVKIVRGQYKKKIGNIIKVDTRKTKVFVEGIENVRKEGTKTLVPLSPSNLIIQELNLDDKKRKIALERK